MVLLNSVLNAIPIFYMSIIKMPVVVWKKIVRLQREFLWGGVKRSRSIPWVSWSVVCQPKCEGRLGVRDLCQVNLALLAKWRWRYRVGVLKAKSSFKCFKDNKQILSCYLLMNFVSIFHENDPENVLASQK